VKLLPHILIFVLSFLIVTFYWTAHHVLFNSIHRSDRYLLWFNALHLLFVVFLPFSTALLADFHRTPLAVDIYGLNIILCSASSIAFWLYGAHDGLIAENLSQKEIRLVAWRLSVNPIVCTVALCIAFVNTTAAILLYLVTPIWYVLTGPDAAAGDRGTWRLPRPLQTRRKAGSQ
jgi:TMEM175 potassium channel family protein